MEHIKLDDKTKQAIESVLSHGDRAVCIPTKDGGVRVKQEVSHIVHVQK